MSLMGTGRLEAVHVGGNWDNSGNAGPLATNGNNSALNVNANVASFGVSSWSKSVFGLVTRPRILSYIYKINTQHKGAPTSKKSERRSFFEKIR